MKQYKTSNWPRAVRAPEAEEVKSEVLKIKNLLHKFDTMTHVVYGDAREKGTGGRDDNVGQRTNCIDWSTLIFTFTFICFTKDLPCAPSVFTRINDNIEIFQLDG